MNTKLSNSMNAFLTDAAKEAIKTGKANRALGADSEIAVGNTYQILGMDYFTGWFMTEDTPNDITSSKMREMSEEELKAANCVQRSWFALLTDSTNLSLSAVMGNTKMYVPEFWENVTTKSEDFDVTKLFKPSARNINAFIANDCDGLAGKTLTCVGVAEVKQGNYTVKVRAFVVS